LNKKIVYKEIGSIMNLVSYHPKLTVNDWNAFIGHMQDMKIDYILYGISVEGRMIISGILLWTITKRLSAKDRMVYSVVNPLEVCIHSTLDGYLAIQTPFKLPSSISAEMKLMLQELAKKKVQIAMKNNRKPVGI
jgi:hypothetical protein